MMRSLVAAGIGAAALVAGVAASQVYRGGTDVVLLSVTVTDSANHHVAGLVREDFRVLEDGVLQDITHFSSQAEPISLSLLMDTSTSMETDNKIALAQQAALGLINRMRDNDVAQIMDFDSQTKVLVPFTGDKAALERGLRLTRAGGSTSMYNAIYTALSELKLMRSSLTGEPRRQAIVLLSDGEDTSSIVRNEDVLELAKRCEVIVYAIGLLAKDPAMTRQSAGWNEAEFMLKALTRETGGRAFFVSDPQQLPAIYVQIAEEISNQYSVGYISKNSKRDGAWRKIALQVIKGDATPRTRAGYYGPTVPR